MKIVQQYPDGMFCWIDLATPDIDAAHAFYSGLFGWQPDVQALDENYSYTNFRLDGYTVAGAAQMMPEAIEAGQPPTWTSYVKHSDIEAAAARAAEAGGAVLVPPMEIPGQGHMAVLQDPTGAVFGLWQPMAHTGAQLVNQPNTLVWNELQARDLDAARAFYGKVFGWSDRIAEGSDYLLWHENGRSHCGGMALGDGWGADVPSNWLVYFLADDVDATAARAVELGGQVLHGPSEIEGFGRMAVLADPHGASFAIIKFVGGADEPPGSD